MTNFQPSLTKLGAGDLIDQAVRFYRKNFWTFVGIAAPPIFAGTFISIFWGYLGRSLFNVGAVRDPTELSVYYVFLGLGNLLIWLVESVAIVSVMGGASRNFVRHILFGEAITFRETYVNTKNRLGGLIVASSIIIILVVFAGYFILAIGMVIGLIAVGLTALALSFSPILMTDRFCSFNCSDHVFYALAFLSAGFALCVCSAGDARRRSGIFAAIGRSTSLASGNVKRFAALFIFTIVATYSALALFYVPLGWYAWANGVEIITFDRDVIPVWYEIASQVVSQISLILLMPVWMIGLCLLYIDERVRHEGYDIELMAARRLGDIPKVPSTFVNPLHPALANQLQTPTPTARNSSVNSLGLNAD